MQLDFFNDFPKAESPPARRAPEVADTQTICEDKRPVWPYSIRVCTCHFCGATGRFANLGFTFAVVRGEGLQEICGECATKAFVMKKKKKTKREELAE